MANAGERRNEDMANAGERWNEVKHLIESYVVFAGVFPQAQDQLYEKLKEATNEKYAEVTKCMIVRNTLVLVIGMLYIEKGKRFSNTDPSDSVSKNDSPKIEYTGRSIDDFGGDDSLRRILSTIPRNEDGLVFDNYQIKLRDAFDSAKSHVRLIVSGSRSDAYTDILYSFNLFGEVITVSKVKSPLRHFVENEHSFPKWNKAQWSLFLVTPTINPTNESIKYWNKEKIMAQTQATHHLQSVRDKLKKLGRASNAGSAEPGNPTKRKSTKKVGTKKITKKIHPRDDEDDVDFSGLPVKFSEQEKIMLEDMFSIDNADS